MSINKSMSSQSAVAAIVSVISLACASPSVQAAEKHKLVKEQKVGLLGGAATGALVGGPFGAAVGAIIGGVMGESQAKARVASERSASLEQELLDTRLALARASAKETSGDQMFDALAERLQADVLFKTSSTELEPAAKEQLEQLGKLLAMHTQLTVELQGYADPRGKKDENLELSERRAEAVRDALVSGGAAPESVRLVARGESDSKATKGDLEAYAWERHVTLKIQPASPQVAAAR
jgi:outer membrane protein OmpA-like peptidoglycan-associated protein